MVLMKTVYLTAFMVMAVLMLIIPLSADADINGVKAEPPSQQVMAPADTAEKIVYIYCFGNKKLIERPGIYRTDLVW